MAHKIPTAPMSKLTKRQSFVITFIAVCFGGTYLIAPFIFKESRPISAGIMIVGEPKGPITLDGVHGCGKNGPSVYVENPKNMSAKDITHSEDCTGFKNQ